MLQKNHEEGFTYVLVIFVARWMVNLKENGYIFNYIKLQQDRWLHTEQCQLHIITQLYERAKYGIKYDWEMILYLFRANYNIGARLSAENYLTHSCIQK